MNLCDIKTVKRIMAEFGTGTKKSFGQNFLINADIPYNIAEESYSYHRLRHPDLDSGVIEIGPGIGSLTYELGQRYKSVVAIEIDKTLIPILDKTLGELDNIKIINDDFLKLDTVKLIDDNFGNIPVSVCANLPYYITTPIIMKLLEESRDGDRNRLTSITVMVQKEVASRLCASEKDKDYGAITASINYYGTVTKLFDVAPDNFLPPPKVTSSVVRIELYEKPKYSVKDEKTLFDVISGAFIQRRKTMLNSLSSYISYISKERIGEIITELGFDTAIRGERLSIEDFCRLADKIYDEKIKESKI